MDQTKSYTNKQNDESATEPNWSDTFTNPLTKIVEYDKKYFLKIVYIIDNDTETGKKTISYELITNNLNRVNSNRTVNLNHPFSGIGSVDITLNKKTNTLNIGGISAHNKVTESLLELIMMTDENLDKECGNVEVSCYRSHLIKMLHELWD